MIKNKHLLCHYSAVLICIQIIMYQSSKRSNKKDWKNKKRYNENWEIISLDKERKGVKVLPLINNLKSKTFSEKKWMYNKTKGYFWKIIMVFN